MEETITYSAFVGDTLLAEGPIETMLPVVKAHFDKNAAAMFLIFADQTGRQVDFDLRGDVSEVVERAMPSRTRSGPGRPRLGVVSREVSLLPRHWDWLEQQPNGASATIRRLIEDARKREPEQQAARAAKEAVGRFMTAMAGNLPGYEEAGRALYAGKKDDFDALVASWPADVRAYMQRHSVDAFREN